MADIIITTAVQGIAAATGALDRLKRGANDLSVAASRSASTFDRFSIAVNSAQGVLAALGLAQVASQFLTITTALDKTRATLEAATGSAALAESEFNDLGRISKILGINLLSTAGSFAQLAAASKGTRLEGVETNRIFNATVTAAARLNLTATDTQGVIRALGQIMSKGKVQAEELRGQLGDRLPGAFNIMARALGVTTAELDKMLVRGEVLAEDALPKLARELEKTFGLRQGERVQTLQAAINRLSNAVVQVVDAIGQAGAAERLRATLERLATVADLAANGIRLLSGEISLAQFRNRAEDVNILAASFNFLRRALPGGVIDIANEVATLISNIGGATKVTNNFAAAFENAQQQQERFAIQASELNQQQRQAILDNIEATEARRKAEAARLESFVQGQRTEVDVRINQLNQQRTAQREAQELARDAQRAAEAQRREMEALVREIRNVEEALDPTVRVSSQYNETLGKIDKALQANIISEQRANELRSLTTTQLLENMNAMEGVTGSIEEQRDRALELAQTIQDKVAVNFSKVRESMAEFFLDMGDRTRNVTQLFQQSFDGLRDTLSNFIQTGKFNFSDLFDSIKKSIADFLASEVVSRLGKFLLDVVGGSLGFGGGGPGGGGPGGGGLGATLGQTIGQTAVGQAAQAGLAKLGIGGGAAGGGGFLASLFGGGGTAAQTFAAPGALGTTFTGTAIGTGGGAAAAGGGAAAAGGGGGFLAAAAPFAAAALPVGAFLFRTLFGEEFDPKVTAANLRARGVPEEVILGKARLARANQLRRTSGKSRDVIQAEARARELSSRGSRFSRRQTGGDLIATSPAMVMVGETGPERLSVEPLGGLRGTTAGGVVVNINGGVFTDDQSKRRLAVELGLLVQREVARLGRI